MPSSSSSCFHAIPMWFLLLACTIAWMLPATAALVVAPHRQLGMRSVRPSLVSFKAATITTLTDEVDARPISADKGEMDLDSRLATSSVEMSTLDVEEQELPLAMRKRNLPTWAKAVNKALAMPMITHKDKYHIHAAASLLWFIGTYPLLFAGWIMEYRNDDWTVLHSNAALLLPLAICGLIMAQTAFPMLPTGRQFANYTGQMKHSMMSAALLGTMAVSFSLSDSPVAADAVPALLFQGTAVVGFIVLLWTALVEGRPWNIVPIMDELKIGHDFGSSIWAAYALSFVWILLALATVSHGMPGAGSDFFSSSSLPIQQAFAVQMALSLAATPASDALVAGTILKNDRFNNKQTKRWILVEMEKGGFRPTHWLEAIQLSFGYGPFLLTIGAAVAHGHWDVVEQFLYLDRLSGFLS